MNPRPNHSPPMILARPAAWLILGLAGALLRAQPAFCVDDAKVDEAVLFAFDDHSIPFTANLQLSMEAPEKYPGNPLFSIGQPGTPDEWGLEYYGSVIRHGGKFMMWYIAASAEGFDTPLQGGGLDWRGWRFAYAESPDGIHWVKPDLGLTEFRGSRHNNLIQMPDGFRGYHALVRYEPEEPDPSRRFKMLALLCATGNLIVPGVVYNQGRMFVDDRVFLPMYSADGLRWRVADELPVGNGKTISPNYHLLGSMEGSGLYKWKGMYYVTSQSWGRSGQAAMPPYGRHIQIWRSPDFLHWSETQTMGYARQGQFRRPTAATGGGTIGIGTHDGANEQTHEGASVWNRGNVLIGITGFWHGTSRWEDLTHDLGFLISNDGLHFREPQPDFLFARVGQAGRDWDYGGLTQGQGFENVGDKTYFWYGGPFDQSEGPRTGRPIPREGAVGLLTLDRDRFGSLSTRDPNEDGNLITSEIEANQPARLSVNAEGLGPDSRLRVELLDVSERPQPGYSGEQAAIVERSGLRVPVSWGVRDRIDAGTRPFKLQVRFEGPERNAIRLYALYLDRAPRS